MKRFRHSCPECKTAHTCTILSVDTNPMSSVHLIRCAKTGKSFVRTDKYNDGPKRGIFAQRD